MKSQRRQGSAVARSRRQRPENTGWRRCRKPVTSPAEYAGLSQCRVLAWGALCFPFVSEEDRRVFMCYVSAIRFVLGAIKRNQSLEKPRTKKRILREVVAQVLVSWLVGWLVVWVAVALDVVVVQVANGVLVHKRCFLVVFGGVFSSLGGCSVVGCSVIGGSLGGGGSRCVAMLANSGLHSMSR